MPVRSAALRKGIASTWAAGAPSRARHGDEMGVDVDLAILAAHRADCVDVEAFEEISGGFKAKGGVMVATRDHHSQAGTPSLEIGHCPIEQALAFAGGVGVVEDVARNDKKINLLLFQNIADS